MTEGHDPRPHVLRVLTRLNIGGIARQELLAARELGPWYRSTVIAGRPPAVEGELTDPLVPIARAALVRPLSPADDLRALGQLRRHMAHDRPALVHTHMAKAGALGRIAALSLRPRPAIVHTYHGHVLEGYFSAPVQRAFVEAERLLAHATDAIISVSEEVRDDLLDLGIGTPGQHHVVRLGLDLSALSSATAPGTLRAHLGLTPSQPLIGTVGRLVPIKDHATLLAAMVHLPGVHLAVLGDGDLRDELVASAHRFGIADRTHFVGWWLDVAGALVDLDLVVLTSRNEGTPVVLIEAAAAGRASVATDVGGVRAIVHDGKTGRLVAPGVPAELADAVKELLADERTRRAMGERARAVADRFTGARLVEDLRALYEPLLAARG
jgi:glycosyltransferase involved in cell wall biosynthesis